MTNVVKFTMNNVPAGLDSMYVRVEEDALTQGVRKVLYSGVIPVSCNAAQIDIGATGNVGDGVIVSADNYTSGGAAFKSMSGYSLIEAGAMTSKVYQTDGATTSVSGQEFIVPEGDFEFTFSMVYTPSASSQTIIGNKDNEDSYVSINSSTSVILRAGGTLSLLTINNPLIEGDAYNVTVYRRGLTVGVDFDDYATASMIVASAPSMTVNSLLYRQFGSYCASAVWDLKITSSSVDVLNLPFKDVSESIVDTVNGVWTISNYDQNAWSDEPNTDSGEVTLGIEGIHERMELASSGINGYNYIVTGDSTRFNGYNRMIEMYQTQLDKINMPRVNNAQSGQSATRWLANEGGATLNAALAATPSDGRKTIMEFSFGLNDYSLGLTESEIKQTLHNCISNYLAQKPNAIVFLVSPVPTGDTVRNEIMERIYAQIANERGLFLINGNTSMINVLGNGDYYQDTTHPNSNGSLRLLNWILSELSPPSLYNTITMDGTWLWPEPLPSPALEEAVSVTLYDSTTGAVVINPEGRKMDRVDVEPNFELNIRHQGNLNTVIFFDFDNVKVASMTYDPSSDQTIIVPAPAVYAMINIADNGAVYDVLNDSPTVRYVIERVANLTMSQINAGNNINLLDVT